MWYTINYNRKFKIQDPQIIKLFNLKNIKEYTNKDDYDIFYEPLFEFEMNGIKYIEIIWRDIMSNWNCSNREIWFVKKEKYIQNKNKYKTIFENIDQWLECPKCKKYHTLDNNKDIICLECWFTWKEEDFN